MPAPPARPSIVWKRQTQELIDEFAEQGPQLIADARLIFSLIGEIPVALRWHEGLRRELSALIEGAVQEAERFGSGTGPTKRAFATDVVTRVLRRYNIDGLPFIPPIDDLLFKPMVGVLVDWSVEVLNLHDAWPAAKRVALPRLYAGAHGQLLRVAVWIWWGLLKLKAAFVFPSKYERELRKAVTKLEPEIVAVLAVLPAKDAREVGDRVVNIVFEIGRATAPHVRLVDRIIRFSGELHDATPAERREAAFRVLRGLVLRAYEDDELALLFLDSSFGDFFLRALVNHTEWVLERNGLLPDA